MNPMNGVTKQNLALAISPYNSPPSRGFAGKHQKYKSYKKVKSKEYWNKLKEKSLNLPIENKNNKNNKPKQNVSRQNEEGSEYNEFEENLEGLSIGIVAIYIYTFMFIHTPE